MVVHTYNTNTWDPEAVVKGWPQLYNSVSKTSLTIEDHQGNRSHWNTEKPAVGDQYSGKQEQDPEL